MPSYIPTNFQLSTKTLQFITYLLDILTNLERRDGGSNFLWQAKQKHFEQNDFALVALHASS